MTREEAYKVLGVTEKSLKTDIEMRYAMLVKRYRIEQDNEKLEEISLAYNIITGRYIEPVEDTPEMKKVVLGKSKKEWGNIWLYGKFKFLAILVGVVFVVYLIYTMVTNTPADFKIATVGNLYVPESEIVSEYILGKFEDYKKVDVSPVSLSLSGNNLQDPAMQQKAMIIMTVSGEDLIVIDKAVFERYASMGAFVELDDIFDEINSYSEAKDLKLFPVKATIESDDIENPEHIYGIDLSQTQLLNSIGIFGTEQILTISIKSKKPEIASDLIRELVKDSSKLLPIVTPIVTPTPTIAPTPTKEQTSKP